MQHSAVPAGESLLLFLKMSQNIFCLFSINMSSLVTNHENKLQEEKILHWHSCTLLFREAILPKAGESSAPRLRALGKDFHPLCFKCQVCSGGESVWKGEMVADGKWKCKSLTLLQVSGRHYSMTQWLAQKLLNGQWGQSRELSFLIVSQLELFIHAPLQCKTIPLQELLRRSGPLD